MNFLPIFLNIRDQPCVVVGGGEIAARKVGLLMQAGGAVRVIAPDLCVSLSGKVADGALEHTAREFKPGDLDACHLVIAATNNKQVNARISQEAKAHAVPVNVVDQPELCSFIMPSIIDRSPVIVAVSSGGASPVLARLLRARLETLVPAAYGQLASLVREFRDGVKTRFKTTNERRRFWESVLQGPIAEMLFAGREREARNALQKAVDDIGPISQGTGEVYLVGAGPGDPDLLSFRALRLMQQADVVLHDRLVADEILALVRRDAELIYVGKERAKHAVRQERINTMLVELAKQGRRVLRLKGGDPFIFGRGGEEIDTLAAEGVPFQVVPGITAASGCAAYAGIPLTHRDYSQSCVFVTGHLQDGTTRLNWKMLAQPQQTVVCYMGLTGLDTICSELIAHGMPPDTPAALIEQGTTRSQRVLTGDVSTLPGLVEATEVHAPTLIIIGHVVRLRDKLAWFDPVQNKNGVT